MSDPVETIERDGAIAKLYMDEDPGYADPRDCDQLGTMYCWHPDYTLGDEQFTRDDHDSMEAVVRFLIEERQAVCILPLFLLDHSGLSMRAGAPISHTLRGDLDTRNRFVGDGAGWDTSHVGFIYTTADRVRELCAAYPFKPSDFNGTPQAWLAEQLDAEVAEYSTFLEGEVYFYVIEDKCDGRTLDSCGGFLGWKHALEVVKGEALPNAVKQVAHEAAEVADWAARDVMTVTA